jgi:hypothetical protein
VQPAEGGECVRVVGIEPECHHQFRIPFLLASVVHIGTAEGHVRAGVVGSEGDPLLQEGDSALVIQMRLREAGDAAQEVTFTSEHHETVGSRH